MSYQTPAKQPIPSSCVIKLFSPELLDKLAHLQVGRNNFLYLTGGTIRDLLLKRRPTDIDLTVAQWGRHWASELAKATGGTYVPLGRDEDAARVVINGLIVDFSSFRAGSRTIEEDLLKRDISVNSLALPIHDLFPGQPICPLFLPLIDPTGGFEDLTGHRIRITGIKAFRDDPLRLLRIFRFAATLGFSITQATVELLAREKHLLEGVAAERISHELNLIMAAKDSHGIIEEMAATGLLWEIIPELQTGCGMEQPASHHLDVFEHNLVTLHRMEYILEDPARFFPRSSRLLSDYLSEERQAIRLKWAALLHDIGKPATYGIREDKGGRITFYNHDQTGAVMVEQIATRLRWANIDASITALLVRNHMRPFYLLNVARRGELSLKSCLRIIKEMGHELAGLFLLSMADALAGQGMERPEFVEQELAGLLEKIESIRRKNVTPVHTGPPLLTGHDLIRELKLTPGPIFKKILEAVEEAQMEQQISTRQEALLLAEVILRNSID